MSNLEFMPSRAVKMAAFGGLLLAGFFVVAPSLFSEDAPAPVPSPAPVAAVAQNPSFAQDLAIASFYGAKDNPTFVIVNWKPATWS